MGVTWLCEHMSMSLEWEPDRLGGMEPTAARLAELLTGTRQDMDDRSATASILEFESEVIFQELHRAQVVSDAWAIDGGQALIADARCLQVVVTRAARVIFRHGECVSEEEGPLHTYLLGSDTERQLALKSIATGVVDTDAAVDINLLRDSWEWEAVSRSVNEAAPGSMILVDGDLQPDWRIPSTFLSDIFTRATTNGITLMGVTKHSSLSRGGAPLIGQLEREASGMFGPRAMWWAPIARTRPDVGHGGVQVVVARLDPDARFAFRVDLPSSVDPAASLGMLSALSDDAAFPGYPYPLSVADRLAACPGWLRSEARSQLDDLLERSGVPWEVRERAFADRHNLMERA